MQFHFDRRAGDEEQSRLVLRIREETELRERERGGGGSRYDRRQVCKCVHVLGTPIDSKQV